jgi:hypothetical protein
MPGIPLGNAPSILNRSFTITADGVSQRLFETNLPAQKALSAMITVKDVLAF